MVSKVLPNIVSHYSVREMTHRVFGRGRLKMLEMLLADRAGVPVALVSHGHVTWVHQEGAESLSRIYLKNYEHKFVVVKEKDGYCVYDLQSAALDRVEGRVTIDDPEIFPTEESAVMAAMLRA